MSIQTHTHTLKYNVECTADRKSMMMIYIKFFLKVQLKDTKLGKQNDYTMLTLFSIHFLYIGEQKRTKRLYFRLKCIQRSKNALPDDAELVAYFSFCGWYLLNNNQKRKKEKTVLTEKLQ